MCRWEAQLCAAGELPGRGAALLSGVGSDEQDDVVERRVL